MREALRPSADVVRIPMDPAARLQTALRLLTIKLAEQSDVVSSWREDVGALATATQELAASLRACQQNLAALDVRVTAAGSAARELDRTADGLLEASARV